MSAKEFFIKLGAIKQMYWRGITMRQSLDNAKGDRLVSVSSANKIAEIVRPKDLKAELSIVYQTVANLNIACPDHLGDWYFTGNFPTPGGNQVVNKAFVNFMKGVTVRAY